MMLAKDGGGRERKEQENHSLGLTTLPSLGIAALPEVGAYAGRILVERSAEPVSRTERLDNYVKQPR